MSLSTPARSRTVEGRPRTPTSFIETDTETFFALLMGNIAAADAVAAGVVKIDGGLDELQKVIELFALQQANSASAEP